mgnify:CR=1 FL=1
MLFELFFGGMWQTIEFGLAILGVLFLLQIIRDIVLEARIKRKEKEEANKIKDKYFN